MTYEPPYLVTGNGTEFQFRRRQCGHQCLRESVAVADGSESPARGPVDHSPAERHQLQLGDWLGEGLATIPKFLGSFGVVVSMV
jgi:hypothetical protein